MAIDLNKTDGGFVLSNEQGESITLSEDDLLTLAQSAQRLRDHVLASRSAIGAAPVAVTLVHQLALETDLLRGALHIGLILAPNEHPIWYSIPKDQVIALLNALPDYVRRLTKPESSAH